MYRRSIIKPDEQKHKLSHRSSQVTLGRETKRERHEYEPPVCVVPTCKIEGELQYLRTCTISDDKTRTSLLKEYRKAKRARLEARGNESRRIGRLTEIASSPHSLVFSTSLANGKIEVSVMADQGADANLMFKSPFRRVQRKMPNVKPIELNQAQGNRVVTGEKCDAFMRDENGCTSADTAWIKSHALKHNMENV